MMVPAKDESPRIAFIASSLHSGGAANVVAPTLAGLQFDHGFNVHLFMLREQGERARQLAAKGMSVQSHWVRSRVDALGFRSAFRAVKAFAPRVIWSLDHHNAIFLSGLLADQGVAPWAMSSHTTRRAGGAPTFKWTDRYMLHRAARVVALTQTHARFLHENEAIPAGRLGVIANGVDVNRFRPPIASERDAARDHYAVPDGHRVVVLPAAFRPEKAHDVALRALQQLAPEVELWLLGEGPTLVPTVELAGALGIGDRIRFMGWVDDTVPVYRAADVMILPSRPAVETQPMAVLEAMAAGVPVIATPVGSVAEMVKPEQTGWLVPVDDAGELAATIARIIGRDRRNQNVDEVVASARALVEARYTIPQMVAGYAQLFEHLSNSDVR